MRLPECIVCGEPVGGESTSWTHSACVSGPGWDLTGPLALWPEWARALKLEEERQRENEGWRILQGIEVMPFCDVGRGEGSWDEEERLARDVTGHWSLSLEQRPRVLRAKGAGSATKSSTSKSLTTISQTGLPLVGGETCLESSLPRRKS
jgi:hypothetical protein